MNATINSRLQEGGVELYLLRISPACRIVWLYLLQNGIPHTLIDVDLSKPTSDLPNAIKSFPHLEVPILTDGDVIVFEAPAILNYLSSKYSNGQSQAAMNSPTLSLINSLVSWANNELHRCIGYQYVYPQFLEQYTLPDQSANEVLVEAGVRSVSSHLEKLETRYLKQSPYLCGQSVTMADMFVASVLLQLEWTAFDFMLWPRVKDWIHRVKLVPKWDIVHQFHYTFLAELQDKQDSLD